MKKFAKLITVIVAMVMCFSIVGCTAEHDAFYGQWGYIHDDTTTVMDFKDNGKLNYKDKDYTYTADDNFLELKDKAGEITKVRYYFDKEVLYIYETTEYLHTGDEPVDGIFGVWQNPESKWSFEFTKAGSFKEDGYFPGLYILDEANGCIKLIYNDHFEDTVIYYTIEGDKLTIEYPWNMVKVKK